MTKLVFTLISCSHFPSRHFTNHVELPRFYRPGVMFLFGKNDIYIHGVRVPADPTNAADLSRA